MAQVQIRNVEYAPTDPDPLGVSAASVHLVLTADVFKELINKLSWAIGSTYRKPYANTKTSVRHLARRLAVEMVLAQGYPVYISKDL